VELDGVEWPEGSIIWRGGDEPDLRVVDLLVFDDPERFDVLVVEPSEGAHVVISAGGELALQNVPDSR
jgi:hypothetical protein